MKRIFVIVIAAFTIITFSFGQNRELKFTTPFYDAVDQWVAFDKNAKDSTYLFGFIYIDEDAGFTVDLGGRFVIENNGSRKLSEDLKQNENIKIRLGQNTANVTILSDEEINQLNLSKIPDWLKYYKESQNENSYLVKIGLLYNSVGASHHAFKPLLEVYEKEPHFKGLEFELAYAYNATKQFDKAIIVLNKAIENDTANFWYYRELGFSLVNQNKLDEAEKVYLQGIKLSNDKLQKAEMAINMAQSYFKVKNKPKFEEWANITKEYADKDSEYYAYINYFEQNWDK
ncbi:MAG: hypothetical protein LBM07_08920 [Culturomica sp.]|jgi:tetratricopeptide (TPR) repeat protein|nr:hypothetical protein [Culturomica sp.]